MKKILTGILALAFFAAGYTQAYGQILSAPDARELALTMTGGGTISSLELVSDGVGGSVYEIVVVNNAVRYEVFINAQTGDVFRLTSSQTGPAQAVAPPPGPGAANRPHHVSPLARMVRPRNPPVSLADAINIAYAHLASLGIRAAFRRDSGMDWERGRWVWELEFRDGWIEYEFYIDVNTGDIVKFEIDR